MRSTNCQSCRRPSQVGDVRHLSAQRSQRLLLHGLLWPAHRHDVQPYPPPFQVEQLVDDERLRQARKPVHHHDHVHGCSTTHHHLHLLVTVLATASRDTRG